MKGGWNPPARFGRLSSKTSDASVSVFRRDLVELSGTFLASNLCQIARRLTTLDDLDAVPTEDVFEPDTVDLDTLGDADGRDSFYDWMEGSAW